MKSSSIARLFTVLLVLPVMLLLAICIPAFAGQTVCVSIYGNDANDGLSWTTAKRTIQAGIDAAGYGGEVWVAQGMYEEGIVIPDGTAVYGSFAGTETLLEERDIMSHLTTIDGVLAHPVVVSVLGSTILDGFRIVHEGFEEAARDVGTGLVAAAGSSVRMSHCYFTGHHDYSVIHQGGGDLAIENCMFFGPSSGINVAGGGCYAAVLNCMFYRDPEALSLHGPSITYVYNNTFAATGAAIHCYAGASAAVGNCVFVGGEPGSETPDLAADRIIVDASGAVSISFSILRNGLTQMLVVDPAGTYYPGIGNLEIDPLLDYNGIPTADSPCIDAGSDAYADAADTDVMLSPRIQGARVDMGAFESSTSGQDQAPVTVDDTLITDEDVAGSTNVLANDSDPDGDPIAVEVVTGGGEHGSVQLDYLGNLLYTPMANYNGTDFVNYMVIDGQGGRTEGTVHITVNPVDDPPVLRRIGMQAVAEGNTLTIYAEASDPDGTAPTLSVGTLPDTATFDAASGRFSWTTDYDDSGDYYVTFSASDGTTTVSEDVQIAVMNVVRPPVLNPIGEKTAGTGTTLTFAVTATSPDGAALSMKTGILPSGATFSFTDNGGGSGSGTFTWNIGSSQAGVYYLQFMVMSGKASDSEEVRITVSERNNPPVAVDDVIETNEDEYYNLSATKNDSDPDGDTLKMLSVSDPPHGTAVLNMTGMITYTPDPDYHGSDSFTYTVGDNRGGEATGNVSVIVLPVAEAPTASFNISPSAPDTTTDVVFTDTSTDEDGAIVGWQWAFGDGSTSTDQNPTHKYTAGTYTVGLTVIDADGLSSTAAGQVVVAQAGNTQPGTDVAMDLGSGVSISFGEIIAGGDTTLVTSSTPQGGGAPEGFKFLGTYYDIVTDATYSGTITIGFPYDPSTLKPGEESRLRVFHFDGGWQDATLSIDTVNHIVYAQVTSLSWFAIGCPEKIYEWQGFLAPLSDATRTFKKGSTIPVKFRISAPGGAPITDAVATLSVFYLVAGAPSGEPEVVSTSAADTGVIFRYSAAEDLYIFNLSTKSTDFYSPYTYRVVVSLDDGSEHYIDFSLKK